MRSLFRLLVLGLLVGGWALASSSLYLVRSPGGRFEKIGHLALIPKDHLTYRDTYVDTRRWTPDDLAQHACVVARINSTHHGDLLKHVSLATSAEGACSLCDAPLPTRASLAAQKKDVEQDKPASVFEFPEKQKN